jgi:hypothetical protein
MRLEVVRKGAFVRVLLTGTVCFGLATSLVSPAPAADKLPSGAFAQAPAAVGRWSLRRITADEAGRTLRSCEATWTREGDLYVYASLDATRKTFAFGVPASRPPKSRSATIRAWFDDDKANAVEGPATFVPWSGDGEGEDGYLLLESGDGTAGAERLAKARKVSFAYPFDGKTRVEAFPYATGGPAMRRLVDCANGR